MAIVTVKKNREMPFVKQAEYILEMPVAQRTSRLGGYGSGGEVIYEEHPSGCPSVLITQLGPAAATFISNGSTEFTVNIEEGLEVKLLKPSFDYVDKREIGVPSQNVWLASGTGARRRVASLINPVSVNHNLEPKRIRIVKLGDPYRAMWYCAWFKTGNGTEFATAVKLALVLHGQGPALLREACIKNLGRKRLDAELWTYFDTTCTQPLVYNRPIWYDHGLPLTMKETVTGAAVPYTEIYQLKRVSSSTRNMKAFDASCDYSTFVGNTAASCLLPRAVLEGKMLSCGAGRKLNRFSTASVAANGFRLSLEKGRVSTLSQSLQYFTDKRVINAFLKRSGAKTPWYRDTAAAFAASGRELVKRTLSAAELSVLSGLRPAERSPFFAVEIPEAKAVSEYANSAWTGVQELYENCRAQGKMLAEGIEVGTRDRAQDMWPKMKEDPKRVREDLVHAFSMNYVTHEAKPRKNRRLTIAEKLHGMFPRQFPSRWLNREREVDNDNRPYADSPLWMVNAACMYIRETGDVSLLEEVVPSIKLTKPEDPVNSEIIGGPDKFPFHEVILRIFDAFERMAKDSPYGMAQILYGGWCDPVDMFGTSKVGDESTRGHGRGVQIRLSAHLLLTLIEAIDLLESPEVSKRIGNKPAARIEHFKKFANELRKNVVRWGWEDGRGKFHAGFLNAIHELHADGSIPDYAKGETGYTLGSMKGRDFDGINRRELTCQAYGLAMLLAEREYLEPVPGAKDMAGKILKSVDTLHFDSKLGLVMFTAPIMNNRRALECVGRMGVVPAGTAENGEYHHGQMFMHFFRIDLPGQAEKTFKQFRPMVSALRDDSLCGPFETPSTSYASDKNDPHFGKGMYFGLSGSVDWIIEFFQKIAGVKLNLHDPSKPDLVITPRLPSEFRDTMTFRRLIHAATGKGAYRSVPLEVIIRRVGRGGRLAGEEIIINGRKSGTASINDVRKFKRIKIEIIRLYN